MVKKGVRHPSAKLKPSNIMTAGNFEAAEIQKYQTDIKQLELKYREIKGKEDVDDSRTKGGDDSK